MPIPHDPVGRISVTADPSAAAQVRHVLEQRAAEAAQAARPPVRGTRVPLSAIGGRPKPRATAQDGGTRANATQAVQPPGVADPTRHAGTQPPAPKPDAPAPKRWTRESTAPRRVVLEPGEWAVVKRLAAETIRRHGRI